MRRLLKLAREPKTMRNPQLLATIIADVQTLAADCEKRLELTKHGVD